MTSRHPDHVGAPVSCRYTCATSRHSYHVGTHATRRAPQVLQNSYSRRTGDLLRLGMSVFAKEPRVNSVVPTSEESRYSRVSWLTCLVLVWFHVQAIAALFSFTWTNLIVAAFLYWVTVGLGISMGYHRLHTHRGFKTSKLFEYFLAVCGTLTLEGGPIFWVATHRLHHQYSDLPGDPHSPNDGAFWSHVGWILFGETNHNNTKLMSKYAPDLARHRFYVWLNDYHWIPVTVVGLAL